MDAQGKKIVILGAGFGGLFAAIQMEKEIHRIPGTEVTLIDKNNYHLFVPLLYQVGTGGIEPGNICFPIRHILANGGETGLVIFRECEVTSLDIEKKVVFTDCYELPYDYLLFALGSITNYYNIPGLEQHVVPLKTITDGIAMRNNILDKFEKTLIETDEQKQRELLAFVIVGGGATGVELASTMALFISRTLERDFPLLVPRSRVILAEAGDTLLHGMRAEMGAITLERLTSLGIEVKLKCKVASVAENGITTADGEFIPSRNVTWVGGIKPSPLAEGIQAEKARDGRIKVNEYLEVPSIPGLYVAGDSAYALQRGTDKAYPPTAQSAVRMGRTAAKNIVNKLLGKPEHPFDYKYKGDLVFLGRNHAVGELAGRIISGVPAFTIYQGYHLETLMGFRNKLGTLLDWTYDYFYRRDTAKID